MQIIIRVFFLFLPSFVISAQIVLQKDSDINNDIQTNKKIKCKQICNKKRERKKEIKEAISFYKNSKYYKFQGDGF